MIGLVMAGGRGSRMGGGGGAGGGAEKLLLPYRGRPVVARVVDALLESGCVDGVLAAVSPNSPGTRRYLLGRSRGAGTGPGGPRLRTAETAGAGYVPDLAEALRAAGGGRVLAAPGDLPLLDGAAVRRIAALHGPGRAWTGIVTTRGFRESLGLSPGFGVDVGGAGCVHAGISVIDAARARGPGPVEEDHAVLDDRRVAFNLNTRGDYARLLSLGAA